jgi:uncharacterized membrane protein YvlD (DUF360 family)
MNLLTSIALKTLVITVAFWVIGLFDADLNFSWEHFAGALLSALVLALVERNLPRDTAPRPYDTHL